MKMNRIMERPAIEQHSQGAPAPHYFESPQEVQPRRLRATEDYRGNIPLQVQAELEAMRSVLISREKQLDEMKKQNATLKTANSRLNRKLDLLAEKVVQARHAACHDALTGLPNRVMLMDRLKQAMARSVREGTQVALMFLDLDGFKRINDTRGHTVGDKLLQQIGERLTFTIRATDTACRYGGDEFMLVLPDLDDQTNFDDLQDKIHATLTAPYLVEEQVLYIKVSIGVAMYPVHAQSAADLINQADLAMYRLKAG